MTSSHERTVAPSASAREGLASRAADTGTTPEVAVVAAIIALLARYASTDEIAFVVQQDGARTFLRANLGGDPDALDMIRLARRALDERAACPSPLPSTALPNAKHKAHAAVVLGAAEGHGPAADFTVVVSATSARLILSADTFDEAAATRIAWHVGAMLDALALGVGPVSSAPLLSDEERAFVCELSNAARVRFDEPLADVVALFEESVRRRPDAPAVVDAGSRTITYRELDQAARTLCRRLQSYNLAAHAHVAVYLDRGADAVAALLGILMAGMVYVPIDTTYPDGRVAATLDAAGPQVIVTNQALAASLPRSNREYPMLLVDRPETSPPVAPPPPIALDDVAYTLFTSGSTGKPKGVVVGHRALANYLGAALEAYDVREDDRVLHGASLGFDLSLEEILVTLAAGATVVVRGSDAITSLQRFADDCADGGLSVLSITSALWHELTYALADGTVLLPPSVRLVILGAEAARPDMLPIWQRATGGRVRLVNTYGLTETAIVATVWEATASWQGDDWLALPIGRPLRNVSAYVLDARGNPQPVGVPGEVCIGGLAPAERYLNDEALTDARFLPDPSLPGRRMYRTGDRGVIRASGELEFLGRADYQVKVGGVRIELGEIESRLCAIPGVLQAVVVVRKSESGQTELEAYVHVASPESTATDLRLQLQKVLPRPAVPRHIQLVEGFPLTPAGKIDRRALAATRRVQARAPYVAPSSALESAVMQTVAQVLRAPRPGMLDDFVSLGGTSLPAVRAASILSRRLGHEVSPKLFLQGGTLRDACTQLALASGAVGDAPVHAGTAAVLACDAVLPPDITRIGSALPSPTLDEVLLTGATGFFGAFVLADLLRETTVRVTCLVRAPSSDEGRRRLQSVLAKQRCRVDPTTLAQRVTVVTGDLEQPNLGLDLATFQRLGATVDAIFHLGAHVNMVLPYERLRRANVLAVESVLRLAVTGRPKVLHHVSTVEVLADAIRPESDALGERSASPSPPFGHEGYAQSKWAAERLVESARARGVPAAIYRPGRLMGHSITGAFNGDDMLVRLIEACGQVGAAPILEVGVDITPVDYASAALVELARRAPHWQDAPPAYHLVHPEVVTWSWLVERIDEFRPIRSVPHAEWCVLLERHAASDARADFLLYLAGLTREALEGSIRGGYCSARTRAALGETVPCPSIDERLVVAYLQALAGEGRFPRPLRGEAPLRAPTTIPAQAAP